MSKILRSHKSLSAVMILPQLLTLLLIPSLGAQKHEPDQPEIAVLQFASKASSQWWHTNGAAAAQDVFGAELVNSRKFRVVAREKVNALMQQKGLALGQDIDPKTAVKIGKLLGANYLLTGTVTQYGDPDATSKKGAGSPGFSELHKGSFVAAMNARLIDVSTGKIAWSDQASQAEETSSVSVGGFGGGVNDERMFDKVMRPVIQKLVASLSQRR